LVTTDVELHRLKLVVYWGGNQRIFKIVGFLVGLKKLQSFRPLIKQFKKWQRQLALTNVGVKSQHFLKVFFNI
jgi:hypothetical protein